MRHIIMRYGCIGAYWPTGMWMVVHGQTRVQCTAAFLHSCELESFSLGAIVALLAQPCSKISALLTAVTARPCSHTLCVHFPVSVQELNNREREIFTELISMGVDENDPELKELPQ